MSMEAIMDGLIERLHPALPGSVLGEVLDQLIYMTDDNGSDIIEVCRRWIAGDDLRRVEAALALKEAFLFRTREELVERLDAVSKQWPQLAPRIAEIIDAWDRQNTRG
ncbi:hypothetical protein ACWEV3_27200 [Saccharopolyspora sp. NPDC003752]